MAEMDPKLASVLLGIVPIEGATPSTAAPKSASTQTTDALVQESAAIDQEVEEGDAELAAQAAEALKVIGIDSHFRYRQTTQPTIVAPAGGLPANVTAFPNKGGFFDINEAIKKAA